MTFTAYIQRQKSLIRSRRDGANPEYKMENVISEYTQREQIIPEYSIDVLFEHLSSLKGLNTEERLEYSKIFSHV